MIHGHEKRCDGHGLEKRCDGHRHEKRCVCHVTREAVPRTWLRADSLRGPRTGTRATTPCSTLSAARSTCLSPNSHRDVLTLRAICASAFLSTHLTRRRASWWPVQVLCRGALVVAMRQSLSGRDVVSAGEKDPRSAKRVRLNPFDASVVLAHFHARAKLRVRCCNAGQQPCSLAVAPHLAVPRASLTCLVCSRRVATHTSRAPGSTRRTRLPGQRPRPQRTFR